MQQNGGEGDVAMTLREMEWCRGDVAEKDAAWREMEWREGGEARRLWSSAWEKM